MASPIFAGVKTPGSDIVARRASASGPSWKSFSSLVTRLVATQRNAIGNSSNDAIPEYGSVSLSIIRLIWCPALSPAGSRSEEHTSELQSPCNLVCRLLLEKKKKKNKTKVTPQNAVSTHGYDE